MTTLSGTIVLPPLLLSVPQTMVPIFSTHNVTIVADAPSNSPDLTPREILSPILNSYTDWCHLLISPVFEGARDSEISPCPHLTVTATGTIDSSPWFSSMLDMMAPAVFICNITIVANTHVEIFSFF
ncbi:uncharacterized protein ARMOST_11689 [Armillaria ostoyae]|uniref:Uncharacterized protein n=1 Tax=Armillaria ostoyae TaxID=47428 RepID=A0A284RHV0_ARMOS|nr:uncharacterized protein ARMOST_11689 [Armillaria ostoyae]